MENPAIQVKDYLHELAVLFENLRKSVDETWERLEKLDESRASNEGD